VVVDKQSRRIVCTAFDVGRCHDFRLFCRSHTRIHPSVTAATDTGYLGIAKLHSMSRHPQKRSKKHQLTKEDKQFNREASHERIVNEHVIGALKRFRIISDRYRNRRRRFGLRFNLIAAIYNQDLN
jgi:hypothetical protein